MTNARSILVLTSCTATKADVERGQVLPAEELYTGQQHVRLMQGVSAYRAAGEQRGTLDLRILSAGHGLVAGNDQLPVYDASFAGMRQDQLRRRARRLRVPSAVAAVLAQPRELNLLLLGDDYLRAAELTDTLTLGATTVAFTSPRSAARLPALESLHVVELTNADAGRFSCGLVALKGELVRRLLVRLTETPEAWIPVERTSLLLWLDEACDDRATPLGDRAVA